MATEKSRLKEITETIKIHCNIAFDDNYYKATKGLINKLKKNKEFSMDSGKIEGWIGGLLYVVGEDSELFNSNNWIKEKRYMSKTDMASGVGISPTTMRNRATDIREALPDDCAFIADITYKDNDDNNQITSRETLDKMENLIGNWSDKAKQREEYEIYLTKARRANNYEEALDYMDKAVNNAKEKIGDELDKLKGKLWEDEKTRPYLLIKDELAYVYALGELFEKAIEVYEEMLDLDEEDNLGIKYKLIMLLIQEQKFEEVEKVLNKYIEDESTFMTYTKALYYFAKEDFEKAKDYINQGFELNKYIPVYLLGMKEADNVEDEYIYGSPEEAMYYFQENSDYWLYEEGCLSWLVDEYFDYLENNKINLGHNRDAAKKAIEYALKQI